MSQRARARHRRSVPADRTVRMLLGFALICAVVGIAYGALSPGTYQDDDIDRFFLSRQAWVQPELFLDRWAMPLAVAVFALPARLFGFAGVEWTTALLTAFAAFATGMAARRNGARWPWIAAAFFMFQPIVLQLSFSALAEPVGAAVLAAMLWAWAGRRPQLAALLSGLLPLARIEFGAISLLVAVLAWRQMGWKVRIGMWAPVVLWNLGGFFTTGEPLFVLSGSNSKPLNSLGVWNYAQNAVVIVGAVVLFFVVYSLASRLVSSRTAETPEADPYAFPAFPAAVCLTHWILLTLLAWEALPVGRSVGFLRHVAGSAPALALVAAWGAERWLGRGIGLRLLGPMVLWVAGVALGLSHTLIGHSWVGEGRVEMRWMISGALLLLGVWLARWPLSPRRLTAASWGLVAGAMLFAMVVVRPIGLDAERETIRVVIEKLEGFGVPMNQLVVYSNHPWFTFLAGRDRYDKTLTPILTRANIEQASPQSLILWDNHYGHRLEGDVPLQDLRNDPRFVELFTVWGGEPDTFRVVGFQKLR